MIESKKDLYEYLEADKRALGVFGGWLKCMILRQFKPTYHYEYLLRKAEYYNNCKDKKWFLIKKLSLFRLKRYGWKLGYSIPINVFGKGLSIAHVGTIVVSANAKIGDYCRLHCCVNIGTQAGPVSKCPTIGDYCYIAPGVKIFGDIKLGDYVAIGANAVVNKSFSQNGITIGGIPAKIISDKGSKGLHNFNVKE